VTDREMDLLTQSGWRVIAEGPYFTTWIHEEPDGQPTQMDVGRHLDITGTADVGLPGDR
jgi:hypothetical protein